MATANVMWDRSVVLASADASLRQRLRSSLCGLRWNVREARGGAEALAQLEDRTPEALLLDHWLPDLEVIEFAEQIGVLYPQIELLRIDGDPAASPTRSLRRHELLHALREARGSSSLESSLPASIRSRSIASSANREDPSSDAVVTATAPSLLPESVAIHPLEAIDGMVGQCPNMLELAHAIRLVAPRATTVLIEGETGTGKEVVAQALHRLSTRSTRTFVVLNCAAIPEALLEAELFGHARGAFTGAVQSRTGRIEAADGGTLFLDEIGEMPLGLQAKMLRFLESGELQRVGENEMVHVDVRVIAATHQPLERRAMEGIFRLDLYHRLAVFPIDIPPLRDRLTDIAALSEHFLAQMGKTSPRKTLSEEALEALHAHDWSGNVRELAHVLERASILAEQSPQIRAEHIRLRRTARN